MAMDLERLSRKGKVWENEEERIVASCISEARESGKNDVLIEVILKMHEEKFPIDVICRCTCLPTYEVEGVIRPESRSLLCTLVRSNLGRLE